MKKFSDIYPIIVFKIFGGNFQQVPNLTPGIQIRRLLSLLRPYSNIHSQPQGNDFIASKTRLYDYLTDRKRHWTTKAMFTICSEDFTLLSGSIGNGGG